MINFQDTIILTTRNPEGFLNLQNLDNISVDGSTVDASILIPYENFTSLGFGSFNYQPIPQYYTAVRVIAAGAYAYTDLFNVREGSINIKQDLIRTSGNLTVQLFDGAGTLYSTLAAVAVDTSLNANVPIPTDVSLRIRYTCTTVNFQWNIQVPTLINYYTDITSNAFIVPITNNVPEGEFLINGVDASYYTKDASTIGWGYLINSSIGYGLGIVLSDDVSVASFLVSTTKLNTFDHSLQLQVWDSSAFNTLATTYDITVLNRPNIVSSESINVYPASSIQVENETSYLVLRTNPKFTGNIVLVADNSGNLFLDTFKISKNLSDKAYRKQQVSASSVISGDIYKTFNSLPKGDLYQLDAENVLNISLPKTTYNKQYNSTYNYGARLFEDNLYEEDYAMLAPLWINKNLPDYFAIFRLNGVYNTETYTTGDFTEFANKYLTDSSLINSWSFKASEPLGSYFGNYENELLNVRAPVFLSLTDPSSADFDPNTWYGIVVDKGIVAGKSETPYRFDQQTNFTNLNWFVSQGFERNNILCPNLINMEYVFSDEDVSLYTMSRYFGLYLTENPLYEIAYYADSSNSTINILSLDDKDINTFFDSSIFNQSSGSIVSAYQNRIFTVNDAKSLKRFTNFNQINGSTNYFINEWVNKPGDNLFTTTVTKENIKPFITLSLNNKLAQGEHLRIINRTKNIIYEAFSLDSDFLGAGQAWPYVSEYSSAGYPTIYHAAFSIKGDISDQILAIQKAFNLYSDYPNSSFESGIRKASTISFILNDNFNDEWLFQRITADTVDVPSDPLSSFNIASQPDDIRFYGVFDPSSNDFTLIDVDASFGPINFEIFGPRKSIMLNFIDPSSYNIYSMDASLGSLFNTYDLYKSSIDNWYRLLHKMDINVNTTLATPVIAYDTSLSITNVSYASLTYNAGTQSYTATAGFPGQYVQTDLFNAPEGSINISGNLTRTSGTLIVQLINAGSGLYSTLYTGLVTNTLMNKNVTIPVDVSLRVRYYAASPGVWEIQKPTITKYYETGITGGGNYSFNYVEDPIESNNNIIILTEKEIQLIGNKFNLYGVYPLVVSLMGINPVKDIDYEVYDSNLDPEFKSAYWYDRSDDEGTYSLSIDAGETYILSIQDTFDMIGDGSISIDSSTIHYSGISLSPFVFNTFNGAATIQAHTQTTVSYPYLDGTKTFTSYVTGGIEEDVSTYYSSTSLLKYPLTVPYVSKWVGVGTDVRNNPLRLTIDASIFDSPTGEPAVNFIPIGNQFNDEISYMSFKYLSPGTRAWQQYTFNDINDVIQDGNSYYTFKELMFAEPYLDVFSKLVYSNYNVDGVFTRSSIAYYNYYKDAVDVIISGLSLSLKVNNSAKNVLNIQDFDKYRVSFISTPTRNKDSNEPFEIIINQNTETILLIWYQGNDILNLNKRYSSTIFGKNTLYGTNGINFQGFKNNDPYWSYLKSPFGVNNSTFSTNIFNIYGTGVTYDSSICSPFAQLNLNIRDGLSSIYNAYSNNSIISGGFNDNLAQYNTFNQYIDYVYANNSATFSADVVNYPYHYNDNTNIYNNLTCDLSTLIYVLGTNSTYCYIIKDTDVYSNNDFPVSPINITFNSPRLYKGIYTYNGWYRPNMNNILEFNYNEDKDLIDILGIDFTLSNTYLKSYNDIAQLWYNKVVDVVTTYDVATANAINYSKNFNIFKAQWDSAYYTLNTGSVVTLIDGYNASIELPTFFGSKLPKLPATLTLERWDTDTLKYTLNTSTQEWTFKYNISRIIQKMFKRNTTFLSNWSGLTSADNVIDDYIANTVLGYYQMESSQINTTIYRRLYGTLPPIAYVFGNDLQLWPEANVNGTLTTVNNEYIYNVVIKRNSQYQYYIKFKLFEK